MIRRSRRQPLQLRNGKKPRFTTGEVIAALAGTFTMVPAICWVTGRVFANGYFTALGIPIFEVSFSTWEYAEQSWLLVVGLVAVGLILSALIVVVAGATMPLIKRAVAPVVTERPRKATTLKAALQWIRRPAAALLLTSMMIFGALLAVSLGLESVRRTGLSVGRFVATGPGYSIHIPNPPSGIPGRDFRLLTVNQGRYFVFNKLDDRTCKPAAVYILRASDSLAVTLSPSEPLRGRCYPGAFEVLGVPLRMSPAFQRAFEASVRGTYYDSNRTPP